MLIIFLKHGVITIIIVQLTKTLLGKREQVLVGLGAFAMRMGRVAIPVLRRYILPVAKQLGRNLLEAAIPEGGQVLAGKKRPSGMMLKHVAETAAKKSVKTSAVTETERRANTDEKQTWTKCQGYDY